MIAAVKVLDEFIWTKKYAIISNAYQITMDFDKMEHTENNRN
jgi:hypothetical protein